MGILDKHRALETNASLLLVASFAVVTVGGIVEIAPLFYLENTIEKVEGVRPYSPLELAGRACLIGDKIRKRRFVRCSGKVLGRLRQSQ